MTSNVFDWQWINDRKMIIIVTIDCDYLLILMKKLLDQLIIWKPADFIKMEFHVFSLN